MDTVRDLLLMRMPPKDTDVQIDVVLPPEQVRPGLDEELTAAVRRWVRVQNTIDVETTEAGGAVGRRLFVLGLLAFFVLQIASIWVRNQANEVDSYLVDSVGRGPERRLLGDALVPRCSSPPWRSGGPILRRRRMRVIERVRVRVMAAEPTPSP